MDNKEYEIKKKGGATEHDYLRFKEEIEYLNRNISPLFILLGFSVQDKEAIMQALLSSSGTVLAIERVYIQLFTERFREGIIKPDQILSPKTLEKRDETPEEREKRIEREVHRRLKFRYKTAFSLFMRQYKPEPSLVYDKQHLEIFKDAVILTPSGLSIDAERFLELYSSYMEAIGSTTNKQHQNVADTINRFFNGAVEITEKELKKYFILKHGVVKPNPEAINRESYTRLGYKGKG